MEGALLELKGNHLYLFANLCVTTSSAETFAGFSSLLQKNQGMIGKYLQLDINWGWGLHTGTPCDHNKVVKKLVNSLLCCGGGGQNIHIVNKQEKIQN